MTNDQKEIESKKGFIDFLKQVLSDIEDGGPCYMRVTIDIMRGYTIGALCIKIEDLEKELKDLMRD